MLHNEFADVHYFQPFQRDYVPCLPASIGSNPFHGAASVGTHA
jgi:hypothetical protein